MSVDYYVVHVGSATILDLSECKIVAVKDDNEEAQEAVDNGYTDDLLNSANAVYSDNQIELG